MFKKVLFASSVLMTSLVSADELSDSNLVTRSLTLKDGEVALNATLNYGHNDDDNDVNLGLNGSYGITDNLSIGLGGFRYKFLGRGQNDLGLELAAGAGIKGFYDVPGPDGALGYGADLIGKYVLSEQTAFTFSTNYVFWNMPHSSENRDEWRFSAGVLQTLMDDLTLSANYEYRVLNDFVDDNTFNVNTAVTYHYSKNWDLGMYLSYSDFDAVKNGFTSDSSYKENIGLFVNYRF